MTNAEAWFNNSLRPRKPEGSLGRTALDGHLNSHTAPELCDRARVCVLYVCVRARSILCNVTLSRFGLFVLFRLSDPVLIP